MALVLVMELTFLTVPFLMLTSAILLADNIEYLCIICQVFKWCVKNVAFLSIYLTSITLVIV